MQVEITDDLDLLIDVFPPEIRSALREVNSREDLLEIVMDLGRLPEARFVGQEVTLSQQEVSEEQLDYVVARIGDFGDDNRAGIERTLHRISAIRNRKGRIVGLTARVGRAVFGTIDIIRDIVESEQSILLLGRPGVGKCITGDSLILTENGVQPLTELIPDHLAEHQFAPINATVFSSKGWEAASHAYSGGLSETFKISTRQGFSLEGTPEHPVLALTETGELAFRRLDQLKPGDYLAIQRGQQAFGSETRLPPFEFTTRTNALDGQVPMELTENLARFLGYLVAKGTLSFDNQVAFSHTDPEVQADMAELTEQLFGLRLRPHLHHGDWNKKDFRIFGVKLRRCLTHLGLVQGRAANKRIPQCILTAPKPVVTAFLSALFEGDGSVYGPDGRIEISSASHELLSQLHVLLLNYGIVGNLRRKYHPKYDRHYYHLTLIGENVDRFATEIGFISTMKRAKLAEFVTKKNEAGHNPNIDVVPYQNERLRELRAHVGSSSEKFYRFTKPDNRAPSYRTLHHILSEASGAVGQPAYRELNHLLEKNYFFDPVKQIELREAYVYDLTVPGSHSFFANGFISHNTTMLREIARILGDSKRVIIVDTSNEIGGDGDIPHPAIGRARRMQVSTPMLQHEVMIEAVENHMPQVIVIDEIGRLQEAEAARTIAERGVQLIGTAHGNTLDNIMLNPTLADLVGGIQTVTLSDEEARRRGTQKSVLERKAPPTFDVVVEIQDWDHLAVHHNVAESVDAILRGRPISAELRYRDEEGEVKKEAAFVEPGEETEAEFMIGARPERSKPPSRAMRIYSYGVSQNRLRQAAKSLQLPISLVDDLDDADAVLTLKSYYHKRPQPLSDAMSAGIPVHVLRSNSVPQIESALIDIFGLEVRPDPFVVAMREAREAVKEVLSGSRGMVELAPQNAFIRRQQHQLAREANLYSQSRGKEPRRRVRIYRNNGA